MTHSPITIVASIFYLTARCHDIHLLMFVCMFLGQYRPALEASRKLRRLITREAVALQDRPKLAMTCEGYYSMHMHVLVRFGRWHDILAEPLPAEPELYRVTTAMHHYARGIAYASLKRIAEVEEERKKFHEAVRRLPAGRRLLSNDAQDVLGVGKNA